MNNIPQPGHFPGACWANAEGQRAGFLTSAAEREKVGKDGVGNEIKRDKLAIYLCRIYAKLTYAGERKDEDENRGEKKTEGKRE